MSEQIIHSRDFEHIEEHSHYNYNYYRNRYTGDVILEDYDDDGCGCYWNLGKDPSFTYADRQNAECLGCGEYGRGFNDEEFVVNSEWE